MLQIVTLRWVISFSQEFEIWNKETQKLKAIRAMLWREGPKPTTVWVPRAGLVPALRWRLGCSVL